MPRRMEVLRMSRSSSEVDYFDSPDPVVVLAADEKFAMPLAVTVRSAIDNLASDRVLNVVVLGCGLLDETKQRLEGSWPESKRKVRWIDVEPNALADVPISGHVNQVAYYRILMPRLLPNKLRRVIYLDSDLVIRGDLSALWKTCMDGSSCLAVQDVASPFLDASLGLPNFDKCGPHLGATTPVANYRELGLDGRLPYLNSGVLVVDLETWREADLSNQMLECLSCHRQHVRWWDQYALNVVLAGKWRPINPRWNQGSHIYVYRGWDESPYDRDTHDNVRNDPHIVHFTTRHKPWKISCLHPRRGEFFKYLDRTEWAGWRPGWYRSAGNLLEAFKTQQRRARFARRQLQYAIKQRLMPRSSYELERAA